MGALSSLVRKTNAHTRNVVHVLRTQSTFKVLFILAFALGLEAGLWGLFRDGFRFLDTLGGAGAMITLRLFSLFFFGMGFMLVISGAVTAYSSIFRSPEIPFLLVRPYRFSLITVYKFIESAALASWAFFLIVIPFIGAYAWHRAMGPTFLLWTILFSIPFLLICCGIGAWIMLVIVRWFPSHRGFRTTLAVAALIGLAVAGWSSRDIYDATADLQFSLYRLVPGMRLASSPLFPSWWVSEGILSLSRGQYLRGGMLWLQTTTTMLVLTMLIEGLGRLVFYDAWQRVQGSQGRTNRSPVLLPRLDRLLAPLAEDTRGLMLKDLRTFFRDPMQWSQTLIFFGLLGLYYANLRTFNYHLLPDTWRNTVAFLNVFSVAAVMCSLGSRFIYPQLSLEGQGFWIVGLSPVSMTRVMLTKFWLSLSGMILVSVALMLLSSHMLDAQPLVRLVAAALAAAISCAVCGLSTGLGAIFLDLEARNPAAIVSGFGGTLNLVLSLAFMLAAIFPFGILFHLHNVSRITRGFLMRGLGVSMIWLLLLTALATAVPLWIGSRRLKLQEF